MTYPTSRKLVFSVLTLLALGGCGFISKEAQVATHSRLIVRDVQLQTDPKGARIDPDELLQGCYGKDCIPSIDDPKFENGNTASWLADDDIVFTIDYNGKQRAYPQLLLNWHEIVNDKIGDKAVIITFCPLCGSALAFERAVNGMITEFGVSGKLYKSDLVMYDRYEGNLWLQITGEALIGPAARRQEKLTPFPIHTTTWGEWKKIYPDTEVLSRDTGYQRDYTRYPYGDYETSERLLFPVGPLNTSIPIKSIVYGVEIGPKSKAYRLEDLKKQPIILDKIGKTRIKIQRFPSGEVRVTNLDTGEAMMSFRLFWFSWASLHPQTDLYKGQ